MLLILIHSSSLPTYPPCQSRSAAPAAAAGVLRPPSREVTTHYNLYDYNLVFERCELAQKPRKRT